MAVVELQQVAEALAHARVIVHQQHAALSQLVEAFDALPDVDRVIVDNQWMSRLDQALLVGYAPPALATLVEGEAQLGRCHRCDPELADLGTKSGARKAMREAGVPVPRGHEDLRDPGDVVEAVSALREEAPGLERAVLKLNDSFSGEGNALFYYGDADASTTNQ